MHETWTGRWKLMARGGQAKSTLLLLHGFTGDAESWRETLNQLRPGRTIVTLTLPGHEPPHRRSGLSTKLPTFETIVDRLAGDLERIVAPPYHVCGYAMGARLALGLLVRHAEKFDRATLIGAHAGLTTIAERKRQTKEDERWIELLRREGVDAFADAWERRDLFESQRNLSGSALGAQRSLRVSHDPEGLAWALQHLGLGVMPSLWDQLGQIEAPADLLAGEHDDDAAEVAERMAKRIPRASVYRIPDVGHNVLLERPDLVAEAIEGTLVVQRPRRRRAAGARASR